MQVIKWFGVFALLCFSALALAYGQPYKDNAVSMNLPASWFVLDKEVNADAGLVTFNKKGYPDTGFVQIDWIDHTEYDGEDISVWAIEALQEVSATKIKMSGVKQGRFGQYPAKVITSTAVIYEIARQVNFYEIKQGNYTVSIQTSQQLKAPQAIKAEYQAMEKSLRISGG